MGVTPAELTTSKVDRDSRLTAGAGQADGVAIAKVKSGQTRGRHNRGGRDPITVTT